MKTSMKYLTLFGQLIIALNCFAVVLAAPLAIAADEYAASKEGIAAKQADIGILGVTRSDGATRAMEQNVHPPGTKFYITELYPSGTWDISSFQGLLLTAASTCVATPPGINLLIAGSRVGWYDACFFKPGDTQSIYVYGFKYSLPGGSTNTTSYSITTAANPITGGNVICSPSPVTSGSSSTCTATANSGYTFSGWSGDCSGTSMTCSLVGVTANKSVTALFSTSTSGQKFDVIANIGGELSSWTFDLLMKIGSADIGKQGNVFVAAVVPVSASGNAVYFNNGGNWIAWSQGSFPPYYSGSLPSKVRVPFFSANDATDLITSSGNVQIHAGYGIDQTDMFAKGNVKLAYTIPEYINTTNNISAVRAIVDVASLQEEIFAEIIAMFSENGQKPLFDSSVSINDEYAEKIYGLQQILLSKRTQYYRALEFIESRTTNNRGSYQQQRLGEGVFGFISWVTGSAGRARDRTLTIYGQLDAQGRQEAYQEAVDRYGTDVVGNSPEDFESRLKNKVLDNKASELNKAMTYSDSYREAAENKNLTIAKIVANEGIEGIKQGVDVIKDATSILAPGIDKGFSQAEKIVKLVNAPGYIDPRGGIEDRAKTVVKDVYGLDEDSAKLVVKHLGDMVKNAESVSKLAKAGDGSSVLTVTPTGKEIATLVKRTDGKTPTLTIGKNQTVVPVEAGTLNIADVLIANLDETVSAIRSVFLAASKEIFVEAGVVPPIQDENSCVLQGKYWYDNSCNSLPKPQCSSLTLNYCTEANCSSNAGGYWYAGTCNKTPACDATHLSGCTSSSACTTVGGYWYGESCNSNPTCDSNNLRFCATSSTCSAASGYWFDNQCNQSPAACWTNPVLCNSSTECSAATGYWYENKCNLSPENTTYYVTTSVGSGGTVTPSSATVTSGNAISFTVTPSSGYQINSVSGCGGTLSGNVYTTGTISSSCTVAITFMPQQTYCTNLMPQGCHTESECRAACAIWENNACRSSPGTWGCSGN